MYCYMMVRIKAFVKLTIIFCFLKTSEQYESLNTSKLNEVKRQDVHNTSSVQERQWSNPKNDLTKNSEFMNVSNEINESFTGSSSRVEEYAINDFERKKERGYSAEDKDDRRIRRDFKTWANETSVPGNCQIPELSCQDCCEYKSSNHCHHNARICFCDSHCTFYNDCCADYRIYCGNKQHNSFGVSQQELSCIKPNYVVLYSNIYPIWVVSKCPRGQKSEEIIQNCEIADDLQLNITTLQNLVPVIDKNNLIYRNEFCAKCNGIERFEYFTKIIKCDIVPPAFIASVTEMAEFASRYCRIYILQMINQISRRCYRYQSQADPSQQTMREKCVSKLFLCQFTRDLEDYPKTYNQCLSSLRLDNNDEQTISEVGISGQGGRGQPATTNFLVTFDVSEGTPIRHVQKTYCASKAGEFYDPYLEICRPGKTIPLVKQNLERYDVVVWLDVGDSVYNDGPQIAKEIISCLAQLFSFELLSQVNKVREIGIKDRFTKVVRFNLQLTNEQTLRLGKANYTKTDDAVLRLRNGTKNLTNVLPLQRLLFFSGKFYLTFYGETFTVFKTTSRQLSCIRKQTYSQGTYISVKNGKYYYINSTNKMFPKSQVFFEEDTKKRISVCEHIVPSTCVGRRFNLTSEEYIKFDNLSIFFHRTKTIYDFGEYDIEDGNIFMCIRENPPTLILLQLGDSLFIKTYLTLICLVLSIVCLFLVIQTYLIFPELRNLPGKNLLSLSISLFLVQLLWLIPDVWFTSILCNVVAVTRHYLFLVSFVAMATIAWDTHSAFTGKEFQRRRNEIKKGGNKKFYKYSAIVWGLPAVLVAPCVVFDQIGIYAVYVNDHLCWFDNIQPQKYLFVLPVGLVLLFNVIFFALTVFRIQLLRSDTRLIRSDQSHRTMFWIFLKLSTLMGFCWLFGFIHLLVKTSTPVFSYLFVIFASLQGVYIALAFVMKKKIWTLYKSRFKRNPRKPDFDYTSDFLVNLRSSKETAL